MTTIRDVAHKLNLSITTVSRALDGYDDVAAETRERVIEAARDLGYVPSRAARQLRRKRAEAIGFILPTRQPRFSDPFFAELIAGLGDEAASQHFDLLVASAAPGLDEQNAYQRWVQSRRVDGIILARTRLDDWRARFLADLHFPFVAYGRTRLPEDIYPHIGVDGLAGVRTLVAHLVDRGHQRLGFVGAPEELTFQADRLAGYVEGLAAASIGIDEELVVEGNLTREGGYRAGKQLLALPQPPSAIIGINDLTAIGVMRAARERGLVVGRDLAVAGFDGIEEAAHTDPPLTTMNQPTYDLARQAVRMLLSLIAGEPPAATRILVQPELIVRASTGLTGD
jgi:LacI family transcriptional regulator